MISGNGENASQPTFSNKKGTVSCVATGGIDIIAVDRDTLVIAEVKTRAGNTLTEPETAVDSRKMRSLAMATNAFVKKHGIDAPIRFDIIAVTGASGGEYSINHIEDAFTPLPY